MTVKTSVENYGGETLYLELTPENDSDQAILQICAGRQAYFTTLWKGEKSNPTIGTRAIMFTVPTPPPVQKG